MSDDETIHVGDVSDGVGGDADADPGDPVELPVVDVLTGRSFITGKSGGGKSVLEGTPVYTEDGRKPIEAVTEGERVLSLNKHTYEQEFREVRATIEHTDDRLIRITLEDGTEIVGTEDHSFLTVDEMQITPVRGEELEEGTWMPLSRNLPEPETVREIDLTDYVSEPNNLVVDGGTITSGPRTEDRHLELDFSAGKVIGLYLAEGSFDSRMTLQISNVDDGVHEFLDEQGFNVYDRTCNKGFLPFAEFLETEFGSGSNGKSIPNWVHEAPRQFRAGIVSGYIDGDGSVGDTTVTAMTKSPELAGGVAELLRQMGISTTIEDKFTLYDGEKRRYQRLRVDAFSLPRFEDVVRLSVDAKRTRLTELAAARSEGDTYNSKDMIPDFGPVLNIAARENGWTERDSDRRVDGQSIHHLTRKQKAGRATYNRIVDELGIEGRARAFGRSDIQWKRVVSIEPLDEERSVYDLDVAGNDNFVANGVFVHNSNTASVIIENLLDNGFPCLIVDTDGEYYGLKEEYEILHAGADEQCDIVVSPEHAEKIATLALEENVPIILDVSGYLEEETANELLLAVTRQLFAKEKKLKKPFLLVLEECHEYMPEGGGLDETGKMLIKIGKRGRKHGLGIVGISQRPADVKKDFITQCDWLVWHRLTWDNDTKVVSRILGSEYADAIEDMGNGEAFVMTDWDESIRRVQFHRKGTFDAGATPGLEDFERPELKSVSGDLVSELEEISEDRARRESEMADLRQELDKKDRRIRELERELEEARDMSRMADRFAQALLRKAEAPYRGGGGRNRARDSPQAGLEDYDEAGTDDDGPDADDGAEPNAGATSADEPAGADAGETPGPGGSDAGRADAEGTASADGGAQGVGGTAPGPATTGDAIEASEVDDDPGDVDPVSRDDVTTESAMQFAAEVEFGTREAVVRELRERVERLPELSRAMLRHYRREEVSEPVAAHVDAGGDGDTHHAYSRHRPIRMEGLIRHADRGQYAYAIPELVREAYADWLDDGEIAEMVADVEAAFVPQGELGGDRGPETASDAGAAANGRRRERTDGTPTGPDGVEFEGLNEVARRLVEGGGLPGDAPDDDLAALDGEYDSVEELAAAVKDATESGD